MLPAAGLAPWVAPNLLPDSIRARVATTSPFLFLDQQAAEAQVPKRNIFGNPPPPPSPRPRLIERRSTRSRANDPPNKETKRRRLRRFPFDPLLSRDWIGSDRLWSHAQYALGLTQAGSIDQATRRRTHVLANHGRNLASSFAVVAETLLLGTNQRPRP